MAKPRSSRNSQCLCCSLAPEKQAELERLHCGGASYQSLSVKYGITRFSVMRHLKHHLTTARKAELMAGSVKVAELVGLAADEDRSVLEILKVTKSILFARLMACGEAGDANGSALIAGKLLDALEKIGRLNGEIRAFAGVVLNQHNTLNINTDPQYPALEAGLLNLIRLHPSTRSDVLELMSQLEMSTASGSNGSTYQGAMIEGEAVRESEIEMVAGE